MPVDSTILAQLSASAYRHVTERNRITAPAGWEQIATYPAGGPSDDPVTGFLRGYGRGRPVPEFMLKGETPPAIRRWYRGSLRAMWTVLAAAAVLALVLPAGLAPRGSFMRGYVDLMAAFYPYIGWAERKSSSMPDVVAVWYALTAPAILMLFLARMFVYPWVDLARVART